MKKKLGSLSNKKTSYDWLQNISSSSHDCEINFLSSCNNIILQKKHTKKINNPHACHLIKGSNFFIVNDGNKKIIILNKL